MKEIKISYLFILIVLVFLSLSVVSAADNGLNDDLNESGIQLASSIPDAVSTSDLYSINALNDSSNGLREADAEIQSDSLESGNPSDDSLEAGDTSDDNTLKSGGDSSNSELESAEDNSESYGSSVIVINPSTYADYFNSSNGAIIEGSINDGDTILMESISDAIFTIDKQVTILSNPDAVLTDCLIRLVKGSSNSVIKGLTIINTKERLSGFYLSGIHLIDSWNNTIANNNISVSGKNSFAIALENSSYDEISNNVLESKSSYVMPLTGSSHNMIAGNNLISGGSNLIYYCPYTVGNLYSRSQYIKSTDNAIVNNRFTSTDSSRNYAVNLEAEVAGAGNLIANNDISNVFCGISCSVGDAAIANNTIRDVSKGIVVAGDDVTVEGNIIELDSGTSAIESAGNDVKITSNIITLASQTAINFTGSRNIIENNTIYTESGWGICYYNFNNNAGYNDIRGNRINSTNAIVVRASRESTKDRIENNDILTDANAICLAGHLNRPTVINNNITCAGEDPIKLAGYSDKDPSTPQNYSIYNNTINGVISNLTDGPWIDPNMENLTVSLERTVLESGESLVIYLKDKNSNPVIAAKLSVELLGKVYELTTDNLGSVSLKINEPVGNYGLSVAYGGLEDVYHSLNQSFNIKVTLPTVFEIGNTYISKGGYFEFRLKDSNGNLLKNKKVTINLNGKKYTVSTDSNGKAKLQVNLSPKQYDLSLSYSGESNYLSTSKTVKITVVNKEAGALDPSKTYVVTQSNFNTFFNSEGELKKAFANSNLVFVGSFSKKSITLGYPVKLIGSGATLYDSTVHVLADGVVVDGLKIENRNDVTTASQSDLSKNNKKFGILLEGVKNVQVTNNNINVDSYDNAYGIYLYESNNNVIKNNVVKAKASKFTSGIFLYDSDSNQIGSNQVSVNGTGKVHKYESSIRIDDAASLVDYESPGMVVPEVFKTYGIILFESSKNDISYNNVSGTSALSKYYTAVDVSTNAVVGIDIYYDSHNNKVHHNNVRIVSKDPYIYGLGVLGDQTGKSGTAARNNNFSYNNIYLRGTYDATGIIVGYNSIGTVVYKNKLDIQATNVTYGIVLEGSKKSVVSGNDIKAKARINYLLEGYHTDDNLISQNVLDARGDFIANVVLDNSNNNRIINNQLSYYTNRNLFDLAALGLSSHPDVILPRNTDFYQQGKSTGNVFEGNTISGPPGSGGSNGDGSANGGSSNNGNSNSNGESAYPLDTNGTGDLEGSQSSLSGNGFSSTSENTEGNTVGTSSSAPVSEAAAYKLGIDEIAAASRSLTSINLLFLCMIVLLILAGAYELYKQSRRDLR